MLSKVFLTCACQLIFTVSVVTLVLPCLSVFIYVYFQVGYNFAMVPAHGLLFSNCTMGSLTCGLGGNPHTPYHAGCRVHPVPPGVALSQEANTEITVRTKLSHQSSGETARPDGNLPHQQ